MQAFQYFLDLRKKNKNPSQHFPALYCNNFVVPLLVHNKTKCSPICMYIQILFFEKTDYNSNFLEKKIKIQEYSSLGNFFVDFIQPYRAPETGLT